MSTSSISHESREHPTGLRSWDSRVALHRNSESLLSLNDEQVKNDLLVL